MAGVFPDQLRVGDREPFVEPEPYRGFDRHDGHVFARIRIDHAGCHSGVDDREIGGEGFRAVGQYCLYRLVIGLPGRLERELLDRTRTLLLHRWHGPSRAHGETSAAKLAANTGLIDGPKKTREK